jgi:hypothetical protein
MKSADVDFRAYRGSPQRREPVFALSTCLTSFPCLRSENVNRRFPTGEAASSRRRLPPEVAESGLRVTQVTFAYRVPSRINLGTRPE